MIEMLCYKDMTFCSAECANTECHRLLTEEVREAAARRGLPVAVCNFQVSCEVYIPKEKEDNDIQ